MVKVLLCEYVTQREQHAVDDLRFSNEQALTIMRTTQVVCGPISNSGRKDRNKIRGGLYSGGGNRRKDEHACTTKGEITEESSKELTARRTRGNLSCSRK